MLAPATLVAAESSLEYLNSHRKRDDFTLSFLQAVYFLRTLKARRRYATRRGPARALRACA